MKTEELKGKKLLEKGQPQSSAREIVKVKESDNAVRIYFSSLDGIILTLEDIEKIESFKHDKYEFLIDKKVNPSLAGTNGVASKDEDENDMNGSTTLIEANKSDTITFSLNKTKEVEILSSAKKEIEKQLKDNNFDIKEVNTYLEGEYEDTSSFDIAKISELAYSLVEL